MPPLELDQRVFQINTIDYLLKCIIQTHFCVFLVRRSRTLRNLKGLALIKSTFNSLKWSISSETHFDFDALSQKAMELLLKLDTIQVNHSWVFVILFKIWLKLIWAWVLMLCLVTEKVSQKLKRLCKQFFPSL